MPDSESSGSDSSDDEYGTKPHVSATVKVSPPCDDEEVIEGSGLSTGVGIRTLLGFGNKGQNRKEVDTPKTSTDDVGASATISVPGPSVLVQREKQAAEKRTFNVNANATAAVNDLSDAVAGMKVGGQTSETLVVDLDRLIERMRAQRMMLARDFIWFCACKLNDHYKAVVRAMKEREQVVERAMQQLDVIEKPLGPPKSQSIDIAHLMRSLNPFKPTRADARKPPTMRVSGGWPTMVGDNGDSDDEGTMESMRQQMKKLTVSSPDDIEVRDLLSTSFSTEVLVNLHKDEPTRKRVYDFIKTIFEYAKSREFPGLYDDDIRLIQSVVYDPRRVATPAQRNELLLPYVSKVDDRMALVDKPYLNDGIDVGLAGGVNSNFTANLDWFKAKDIYPHRWGP